MVLEGHLLRLWKCRKVRHISPSCTQAIEDILGQGCRVQLEVCFEKKVGDVIASPLARFFQWCPKISLDWGSLGDGDDAPTYPFGKP